MAELMRMIVVIVDRGKGEEVAEFGHENNVDYAYLTYGRGTLRGEMLNLLGLGTVDKDVVVSLIPKKEVKTHLAGLTGLLKLKRPGKGIAFSIPVGALNGLVASNIEGAYKDAENGEDEKKEGKPMEAKFSLIVAVVEAGFVDQTVDAAKSAGATGGTLLNARGVGREEGETIMGANLQTEKQVVAILAERTMHKEIMEAINKDCGILSEAKGVVFSLPVDELAGIGT